VTSKVGKKAAVAIANLCLFRFDVA